MDFSPSFRSVSLIANRGAARTESMQIMKLGTNIQKNQDASYHLAKSILCSK